MTVDYCIKPGYRARQTTPTVEQQPGDYWNAERIAAAARYQHDVYELARDIAVRMGGAVRIADVGCGYPLKAARLLPFGASVTAWDQPTLQAIVARDFPELQFRAIDLEHPLRTEATFDVIVCADVIEHLLDPDPCLVWLRDRLSAHGMLVLSTPERDLVRGPQCMASDKPEHVREWNLAEFARYVRSRGLTIVDHLLLPPARLSAEELAQIATRGEVGTARVAGCQVVLCVRP